MAKDTKSPLKDKPLRNAGQSLDEEINRVIDAEVLTYYFIAGYTVLLAILEWYRWYSSAPYSPVFYSILALGAASYSAYRIIKVNRKVKTLKQGRNGERAVGQHLEFLREDGSKVFHDILGDGFNVDHVVISPNGIFTVETKTYSKPSKGRPVIKQKGDELFINGTLRKPEIIVQAKAQANWLKNLLRDISGKEFPVQPVVVFPGWYIEKDSKMADTWVLNPKALRTYIKNSEPLLTPEEVHFLANGLSRHIRNTPEK